jgi:hypothetical protein
MNKTWGLLCAAAFCLVGCGGGQSTTALGPVPAPIALPTDPPPAAPSSNSLPNYDAAVAQLLDDGTKHPVTNDGGQVVWGTRWYMESLITAYRATGNQKYIDSLIDTGNSVLSLVRSLTVLNIPDPGAPGPLQSGAQITVTGWPTYIATFGESVAVPAADGQVSFYAQSLHPAQLSGPSFLEVVPSPLGGVTLNWTQGSIVLGSSRVSSIQDLNTIAAQPLDYFTSFARIKATGLGLPAPGSYQLDFPYETVWHGEQTGGILLPFVQFLLLAKQRPYLADSGTVAEWTSQVLAIAGEYEDQLVPDGKGGLVITNPIWMPSTEAGLPAPSDYINAEISMRMFLYQLTGDAHEFALAQGLFVHELTNLQTSSQGWLLLKDWPDIHSWSQKSQAPYGSIYDSLTYNNVNEEATGEGQFFVDIAQTAADYGLYSSLGLTMQLYQTQQNTFSQYIRLPFSGSEALVRAGYPTINSL